MKAISLWQPWASLWLSPHKVHETRHWRTNHRGQLAVHAAQRKPERLDTLLYELACREFGYRWSAEIPRGAIIGIVDLIDCRSTTERRPVDHEDYLCGDWSDGRYAWQRGLFRVLSKPIPFKGRQGFFTVPDELVGAHLAERSSAVSAGAKHVQD